MREKMKREQKGSDTKNLKKEKLAKNPQSMRRERMRARFQKEKTLRKRM
jgi:hypothetical protein